MSGKEFFSLAGRVAIVTGAGRGLGKVMALALADAGADVMVAARTPAEIEETKREIEKMGRRSIAFPMDVTKRSNVQEMAARTVSELGRVDVLVNNAGGGGVYPFLDLSEEEWRYHIDLNLTGTFFCCQAVGKYLVAQGSGRVINISSIAGQKGTTNLSAYGAAKAGVINLTKTLAKEWARFNVSVNCIAPGTFDTQSNAVGLTVAKTREAMVRKIAFRRVGQPREIGPLVVYLASDASSFVTGAIFNIDGGETAG
jgi:NAD(P)-dependent dehydrogenase (short-subunit alcohol dehydrogenase family)